MTSKFKNWLNILRVDQNKDSSVNCNDIISWKEKDNEEVLVLKYVSDNDNRVPEAKEKELMNLDEMGCSKWVADNGKNVVSTKWVLTEKNIEDDISIVKARLVARGFEETLFERTDFPTCSKQSL